MVAPLILRGLAFGARFAPKLLKVGKALFIGKTPLTTGLKSFSTLSGIGFITAAPGKAISLVGTGAKKAFQFGRGKGKRAKKGASIPELILGERTTTALPTTQICNPLTQSCPGLASPTEQAPDVGGLTAKDIIGILGAAGLGAGAIAAAPIVIERARGFIADRQQVLPVLPEGSFQPLAPVEQPVEVIPKPAKPVVIKNTFKPSIDISFKKSKRFINQQINVK